MGRLDALHAAKLRQHPDGHPRLRRGQINARTLSRPRSLGFPPFVAFRKRSIAFHSNWDLYPSETVPAVACLLAWSKIGPRDTHAGTSIYLLLLLFRVSSNY